MPKKSTMCAENAFYKARIEAAMCNDCLASREGAAEEIGIDRTRLARVELGSIVPYPEEVQLMAEAYGAPQLANFYCSKVCPLGKHTRPSAELRDLDSLTIHVLFALSRAAEIRNKILEVAATEGETAFEKHSKLIQIMEPLESIEVASEEVRIFIKKHGGGETT